MILFLVSIISIVVLWHNNAYLLLNLLQCFWSEPENKHRYLGKHFCNLHDQLWCAVVCLFNWEDAGSYTFSAPYITINSIPNAIINIEVHMILMDLTAVGHCKITYDKKEVEGDKAVAELRRNFFWCKRAAEEIQAREMARNQTCWCW